ncbi:carbohydrate kinase family protein [Salinirubrum litoreum]|uniref:Carbohydrate kinase family protein n=1 Tax=Salinirubrum litoreum TaxID=1126234 RepID=A0ABD5R6K9_9EURY|nr:carbohydrate kinase family protein [Salinirubrum litoreum]
MARVVTVGSAVVDRVYPVTNLPAPDGGAFARDEQLADGGVAANVAVASARLGHEAGVVSRVGGDADGDRVVTALDAEGVETTRLARGDERTSFSLILRDDDGERMIVNGGAAVGALRLDAADRDYYRDADAVFTSAYAPDPVVSTLLDDARAGDCPPLLFDLAGPFAELDGRGTTRETVDALLPHVDCFLAGEVALRSYLDCTGREAAEELQGNGVERTALTRGADGALLIEGEEVVEVPAFDVPVRDTTGAGDAFAAGLVDAWLCRDLPAREAGRFAAAVAAENCTAEGARGGLPDRETVAERLAE